MTLLAVGFVSQLEIVLTLLSEFIVGLHYGLANSEGVSSFGEAVAIFTAEAKVRWHDCSVTSNMPKPQGAVTFTNVAKGGGCKGRRRPNTQACSAATANKSDWLTAIQSPLIISYF